MNDKKCKVCELTKPITEFFPSSRYKGKQYYRGECKDCTKKELRSDQTAQTKYRNSPKGKYKKWLFKQTREYRKQQTEYEMDRLKNDPFFKMKHNIRNRLRIYLKKKFWTKDGKFAQYIGCTKEELITHFESKFTEGMTWEVFLTTDKIHIDHVIPLSSVTTEEELYKLCHYTNLQPLWAIDNIKKSNKI